MDIEAYMKQFDVNFAKLKANREKIPLEQLQTKYAKAYNALVQDIEAYAVWFADEYCRVLAIPEMPGDEAGVEWLHKKVAAIHQQEREPGRLRDQMREALVTDLDQQKYEDLVYRLYERLMKEAFDPYQQRFNKWTGEKRRWIYNSLFKAFWLPKEDYTDGGYWIDHEWNFVRMGYPPKIGADPEQKGD